MTSRNTIVYRSSIALLSDANPWIPAKQSMRFAKRVMDAEPTEEKVRNLLYGRYAKEGMGVIRELLMLHGLDETTPEEKRSIEKWLLAPDPKDGKRNVLLFYWANTTAGARLRMRNTPEINRLRRESEEIDEKKDDAVLEGSDLEEALAEGYAERRRERLSEESGISTRA